MFPKTKYNLKVSYENLMRSRKKKCYRRTLFCNITGIPLLYYKLKEKCINA